MVRILREHGVRADGVNMSDSSTFSKFSISDLPESTGAWLNNYEQVEKLFKAHVYSFEVDTIFWPDNDEGKTLEDEFVKNNETVAYEFIEFVLAFTDITDVASWYGNKTSEELRLATYTLFAATDMFVKTYRPQIECCLHSWNIIEHIGKIRDRLERWLTTLKYILCTQPAFLCEKAYEECFARFVEIFGIKCRSGECYAGKFDYQDIYGGHLHTVTSKTDLVLLNYDERQDAFGLAVVEVKKVEECLPKWDVQKSQKESQEGTASLESPVSQDIASNGIVSHEFRVPAIPSTSRAKKRKLRPKETFQERYKNGRPRTLTEEQRNRCELFLPQLLGEAVAATNNSTLKFCDFSCCDKDNSSVIGVAVLGFDVHFVNFLTTKKMSQGWSMHKIPRTPDVELDVLVSEPLNLLIRQDRNKLVKALFAMRTMRYAVWQKD